MTNTTNWTAEQWEHLSYLTRNELPLTPEQLAQHNLREAEHLAAIIAGEQHWRRVHRARCVRPPAPGTTRPDPEPHGDRDTVYA